jgi:hypothetical protein
LIWPFKAFFISSDESSSSDIIFKRLSLDKDAPALERERERKKTFLNERNMVVVTVD